jgi:hypothetical protein
MRAAEDRDRRTGVLNVCRDNRPVAPAISGGMLMRIISFIVACLILFASGRSSAGDFMDTRLTWTFGDEDFLHNAGEVIPDTPKAGIGDRKGYQLFMDNLNLRNTGRENQTHLVMYKKMPSFFPKLTTEAAMVLQIDFAVLEATNNPNSGEALMDDGSYIKIGYNWDETNEKKGVFFTFFPFDTERFRLGYLWDISWGGGGIFSSKKAGPAPGAKIEIATEKTNLYLGFKATRITQISKTVQKSASETEELTVQEMNYGFLGGAGVDLGDYFRIDLGGGVFQQGTFVSEGLVGSKIYTFGTSGRLTLHKGLAVPLSIDYMLYRNDPSVNVLDWGKEKYEAGTFSYCLSAESTILWQHLEVPDVYGKTKLQPAYALAVQARIKYGYFRTLFTGLGRNLEFILHNVPSLTPFKAISDGSRTEWEKFFAGSIDYYLESAHLTPSFTLGVQFPATYTAPGSDAVLVIRDEDRRDHLPSGYGAKPITGLRLGLQWDLSDMMSLFANFQIVHDENLTKLETDDATGQKRVFRDSNQVGFYLVTRAKF